MPPIDVMKVWRDMSVKTFFLISGETFQKNSATTALHVSNPMMGELYIGPAQAAAIKPYEAPKPKVGADVATSVAPKEPVAPRDPEIFETKIVPREKPKPNFGATEITVTPTDAHIMEVGIQPSKEQIANLRWDAKTETKPAEAEAPVEAPAPAAEAPVKPKKARKARGPKITTVEGEN